MAKYLKYEQYNPKKHLLLDEDDIATATAYLRNQAKARKELLNILLKEDYLIEIKENDKIQKRHHNILKDGIFMNTLAKIYSKIGIETGTKAKNRTKEQAKDIKRLRGAVRRALNYLDDDIQELSKESDFTFLITQQIKVNGEYIRVSKKKEETNDVHQIPISDNEELSLITQFSNNDKNKVLSLFKLGLDKLEKGKEPYIISIEKSEYDNTLFELSLSDFDIRNHNKFYLGLVEHYLNNAQFSDANDNMIRAISQKITTICYKFPEYLSAIEKWISSPNMSLQAISIESYAVYLYEIDKEKLKELLHKTYNSNPLSHKEIANLFIYHFWIDDDWLPLIDRMVSNKIFDVRNIIAIALSHSIEVGNKSIFNYLKRELQNPNNDVRECITMAIAYSYYLSEIDELLIMIYKDKEDERKKLMATVLIDLIYCSFVYIPKEALKESMMRIIFRLIDKHVEEVPDDEYIQKLKKLRPRAHKRENKKLFLIIKKLYNSIDNKLFQDRILRHINDYIEFEDYHSFWIKDKSEFKDTMKKLENSLSRNELGST